MALLLCDFVGLPFIIMPILWAGLTAGTAALILGYQGLLGRALDGSDLTLPLTLVWILLLVVIWAKIHQRIRLAMERSLGAGAGSAESDTWIREAAGLGLYLLKLAIFFILMFVLMLGQFLLWMFLWKIPAGLLAWDFDASDSSVALLVLFMVLEPLQCTIFPDSRPAGQDRYPVPGPYIVQRTASSRTIDTSWDA